jgi:hypothetical protein
VIPVKKCHRRGKHRNPEDSCRNYQPRQGNTKREETETSENTEFFFKCKEPCELSPNREVGRSLQHKEGLTHPHNKKILTTKK